MSDEKPLTLEEEMLVTLGQDGLSVADVARMFRLVAQVVDVQRRDITEMQREIRSLRDMIEDPARDST